MKMKFSKVIPSGPFFKRGRPAEGELIALKGSTLIETLTSLALLGIVFSVGLLLFQQLNGLNAPTQTFQNRMILLEVLNEPLTEPWEAFEEQEIKGRRVVREIKRIDKKLVEIEVRCYWKNRLLVSRKKMVAFQGHIIM